MTEYEFMEVGENFECISLSENRDSHVSIWLEALAIEELGFCEVFSLKV